MRMGYGLENIIDPEDPINLSPVRDLFPHIPHQVFETLPKRRVDILIGINYNRLHPVGGEGDLFFSFLGGVGGHFISP